MPTAYKTLSPELTTLITTIAAAGGLAVTDSEANGSPPTANDWTPGALFQAMFPETLPAQVLLALGTNGNNLLAIHFQRPAPRLVALTATDAFTNVSHRAPAITTTSNNVTGMTTRATKFVENPTGPMMDTPKLIPLPQRFAPLFIEKHSANPGTLRKHLCTAFPTADDSTSANWLQLACIQGSANTTSILALTPSPVATPLTAALSETIRSDLFEFSEETHVEFTQILDFLTESDLFTLPTPPGTNDDGTRADQGPPPAPTNAAAQLPPGHNAPLPPGGPPHGTPPPAAPIPLTVPPRHTGGHAPPTHPLPAWNRYPQWTPPQHRSPPTPNPTPGFPPTGTPPAGLPHYTPVAPPNLAPSILPLQEQIAKRMLALLSSPTMSPADYSHLQILDQIAKGHTPPPTASPSNPLATGRLHNLLGWSGGLTENDFHTHTQHVWQTVLQHKTLADREQQIRQVMLPVLVRSYPKLKKLLHHEFIRTIAQLAFAPRPDAPSNKPGLGPLAFVPRTTKELQAAQDQLELLAQASFQNIRDIEKTKLNTPVIPAEINGLITVLENQCHLLYGLFSHYCPLAQEIHRVVVALSTNDNIANIADFKWAVAAEILHHISTASITFFEHHASQQDITTRTLPSASLSWLAEEILRGRVTPSNAKPRIFTKPATSTKPTRNETRKRSRDTNTDFDRPRTDPITKQLSPKCQALVTAYRAKNNARLFPKLADIRKANNFADNAAFKRHIGIADDACMRYEFYGECTIQGCQNTHNPTASTNAQHPALLAKALSNG